MVLEFSKGARDQTPIEVPPGSDDIIVSATDPLSCEREGEDLRTGVFTERECDISPEEGSSGACEWWAS